MPSTSRPRLRSRSGTRLRLGRAPVAVAAAVLVVLTGCSGDSQDAAVKVARADVTRKQAAVVDAQNAATSAATAFCTASADYITAIDRYGDLLTQTATTVGDVVTAGSDLDEPSADAVSAGQDVTKTKADLASAEADLAAAEDKLADAEQAAAGETPAAASSSPSPSPSATATPASVARVQQAEQQFTAAQEGITQQTPLGQAAEQFNSAAVALEMAWLQLFADAKCLDEAQQEQAVDAVASYTKALQKQLAEAGYYKDDVDGIYGPATVAAVQALQKANGLAQTGTVDKATDEALQSELAAKGGAAAQEETVSTAALQQTLKLAGYWTGPVDGKWTDELTDALKAFQKDLGVKQTGTVDAATIAAFEKALAKAQATPSPSPSASTETPSPTS